MTSQSELAVNLPAPVPAGAARARVAAEVQRLAALTALCFVGWTVGLVGEATGWLPHEVALGVYVVAYLAGGLPSAARALSELSEGAVGVDLLMVVAAIGAATVGEWPEGAFLLFLFSLSNTLEHLVLGRTRRAIAALMELSPEEAVVRRDGTEQTVAVADLRPGDVLILRPGERVAADGVIVAGATSIDQSAVTGESIPVDATVGDRVLAGTLNQQGAVEVRVTRPAAESTLARLVRLVEMAQRGKAQSQRFTDWFGSRYTIAVLVGAALTLVVPRALWEEPWGDAFYRAMTLLVAASPCAVVLSIPAAILTAITAAARHGVLFKGGAYLERLAGIRAIAFDKTGTLTVGRPKLLACRPATGVAADDVLRLAAAAEGLSEHPLARAVVGAARERGLSLEPAADLEALVGRGIRARVGGRTVWVGKAELFAEQGRPVSSELTAAAAELAEAGQTTLFVGDETGALGVLGVADTVRPGAGVVIDRLRGLGVLTVEMLTGDNPVVARAVALPLGVTYRAGLLPPDKVEAIRRLHAAHGAVAMVGDGINDAPSLAAADVGISLGGAGTDVALETADVVLMADDLAKLPYAIALARQAGAIIRQNLAFALAAMLLLIAATFTGWLRMPVAVIGHEGSTVLVIFNGLRLLAFRERSK